MGGCSKVNYINAKFTALSMFFLQTRHFWIFYQEKACQAESVLYNAHPLTRQSPQGFRSKVSKAFSLQDGLLVRFEKIKNN